MSSGSDREKRSPSTRVRPRAAVQGLDTRFGVLVLIAAVALATLTLVPLFAQRSLASKDARQSAAVVAQLSAQFVQQQLTSLAELTSVYADQATSAAQKDDGSFDYAAVEVQDLLAQFHSATPGLRGVLIADTSGAVRASEPSGAPAPENVDVWQWLRQMGGEDASVSVPLISVDRPGVITVVSLLRTTPAPGEPVEPAGVIAVEYDADKSLQRLVDHLLEGEGLKLTVTDDDGRVVATPEASSTDRNAYVGDDPDVASALRGEVETAEGSNTASGFAPVDGMGWTVRADVPIAPLLAAQARSAALIFGSAAVLGVMLAVSLIRLAASLRRKAQAEAGLRASERDTRAILEAATDGFVSVDPDGRITEWNEQAARLFGWPRDEAIGQPVEAVVAADEDAEACRALVTSYLHDGKRPWIGQRQMTAAHRERGGFPVEVAAWVSGDPQTGRTVRVNAFVRDITERVKSQQALAAARDEAMQATRIKSEFLTNMSHEIRTPLAGVIGMSQLLLETDLTAEQRSYGVAMVEAGEHLLSVIGYILDLGKMEAGKTVLEPTTFSPAVLVERVVRLLSAPAQAKGLVCRAVVKPTVPETVVGDVNRLQQILVNLAGNAIKFTEHGEVRIGVELEHEDDSAVMLRFTVADTGIGIPRTHLDRLFEPFTQGDASTTRTFGGTGLGLSIVAHLTDLFGGTLHVDTEVGRGTTVEVLVPLEPVGDSRAKPAAVGDGEPATDTEPEAGPQPGDASILVVEDNDLNQRVAEAMLTKLGYQVTLASGGQQALELLSDRHFDVVLMDCQMPGMDGYTTTRRLRALQPEHRTPVIAMTANALGDERQRCLDAGMDDYVTKPVRGHDLARLLDRWINPQPADDAAREPSAARGLPSEPELQAGPDPESDQGGLVVDAAHVLDPVVVGELRKYIPASSRAEMVANFEAAALRLSSALDAVIISGDDAEVARLAHELRGATASIGAVSVATACERLEAAAGDRARRPERYADVQAALERARPAVANALAVDDPVRA